jgi:eukaryotic-like serine/threonine-protein kinase
MTWDFDDTNIEPAVVQAGAELAPGYRVIALLSRGNDLDVYEAWSDELESRCVIKTLRPDRLDRPKLVERLAWEGQMLTTFAHPHVVRGYATVEVPQPMIVMETLTGFTLEALLTHKRARLPLTDLLCLAEHLCAALHYLHNRNVLHLDLKPQNVVSEAGKAKIIDFSLAHAPGRGPAGWGTAAYMAPEQATGDEFTSASDMWAVGLILYEAASGVQPFEGIDSESGDASLSDAGHGDRQATYRQLSVHAAPIRSLRRLPAALSSSIDRCLTMDPGARPTVPELLGTVRALNRIST